MASGRVKDEMGKYEVLVCIVGTIYWQNLYDFKDTVGGCHGHEPGVYDTTTLYCI
jgi:hypothetical protein